MLPRKGRKASVECVGDGDDQYIKYSPWDLLQLDDGIIRQVSGKEGQRGSGHRLCLTGPALLELAIRP